MHLLRKRRLRFLAIILSSQTSNPKRHVPDAGHVIRILSVDVSPDGVRNHFALKVEITAHTRHDLQHMFRIRLPVGRHVKYAPTFNLLLPARQTVFERYDAYYGALCAMGRGKELYHVQ